MKKRFNILKCRKQNNKKMLVFKNKIRYSKFLKKK